MAFPTGPAAVVVTFTGPAVVHLAVPTSITTFRNGLAAAEPMWTMSFLYSPVAAINPVGATIKSPRRGHNQKPGGGNNQKPGKAMTAIGMTITLAGIIRTISMTTALARAW